VSVFTNILFPTDFSTHARAALKYAAAFARSSGGRVVLFNVQSAKTPANLLTLPEHVFEQEENAWLLQLRAEIRLLLADPLLAGMDVEPVIAAGEPAPEIARAVQQYDIDLVTVVTHSRKGISRALWGSTAEEIIAEVPCPVLTIRPPQHDFVEHRGSHSEVHLNRILLATNFRPSSVAATQLATQLANRADAELHVVYVIGDFLEQISVVFPEGGLGALTRLQSYVQEKMTALKRDESARAIPHILEGRPYEEIVRLAAEQDADLIVIGTNVHASLFGGAPVLGSDVERVVRNAPCPVLCVPSAKVLTPIPARVNMPLAQA
jgi:nucleotide-binding universal stress UspA family protein